LHPSIIPSSMDLAGVAGSERRQGGRIPQRLDSDVTCGATGPRSSDGPAVKEQCVTPRAIAWRTCERSGSSARWRFEKSMAILACAALTLPPDRSAACVAQSVAISLPPLSKGGERGARDTCDGFPMRVLGDPMSPHSQILNQMRLPHDLLWFDREHVGQRFAHSQPAFFTGDSFDAWRFSSPRRVPQPFHFVRIVFGDPVHQSIHGRAMRRNS
jgi:hypothetical protein